MSSRRDLLIEMVVERFIFKNNEITLSPCFTFIPKTGVRLLKTGLVFTVMKSDMMYNYLFSYVNYLFLYKPWPTT